MKKYTVLILYPDYASDNFGEDTFMTCVEADSVKEAQTIAQQEAHEATDFTGEPGDYAVLMAIEGDHADIKE